jgi:hypothetical protein
LHLDDVNRQHGFFPQDNAQAKTKSEASQDNPDPRII